MVKFFILVVLLLNAGCRSSEPETVRTGLDNVINQQDIFSGKNIGIITNHTAYDSQGRHIIDVFAQMPSVKISALFGPEHGIRGQQDAGKKIDSEMDPVNNTPIYSLYGKTTKPTPEMLNNVDILVFDIQDIGARFYTYIWTMARAMEAAAEQGIPFVVLDRPNPINGNTVEGTVLEAEFATFVGLYPIPVRHGMTVGELARMFNDEGWLAGSVKAELTVIPVSGWNREQWFDETELKYIKPSPNMPGLETATVYPGLCLLEGVNVSEGRGTHNPFLQFGAPWIDAAELTAKLQELNMPGIKFKPHSYRPKSIPGMSTHPAYRDEDCNGCRIEITNRAVFKSYFTGIRIVQTIYQLYPDSLEWHIRHFDRLCGTADVREEIIAGKDARSIEQTWQDRLNQFLDKRKKYLLYH